MGPMGQGQATLTTTQQDGLTQLLAQYDAENLSDDDAKALVSGIQELGIKPGSGLTTALADAGIDARGLAEQAGLGKPPPPGGGGGAQGSSGPDSAAVETLRSIVETLQAEAEEGETEFDFTTALIERMEEAGLNPYQPTLDYRV